MRGIKSKVKLIYGALLLLLSVFSACNAVSFSEVYSGVSRQGVHSRGLSVHDSLLAISGAKGQVSIFNLNTQNMIDSFSVPAIDLRGVQWVSGNQLMLMNSGKDGIVYNYDFQSKEYDTVLFEKAAFFDAMRIDDSGCGFLMGDPKDGEFVFYKTKDYGENWSKVESLPVSIRDEAGFAASNTGISFVDQTLYFGTGAADTARLFKSDASGLNWQVFNTPMKSGESFGIYSVQFWSAQKGMVAGGSYVEKTVNDSIVFMTSDGGKTWKNRSCGLPGYISCISANKTGGLLIATGRLGTYYSINEGKRWKLLTNQPFYAVTQSEKHICLSGQNGTMTIYQVKQ